MPLSTYDELQTSILSWLARPGDPLVSPAVPDMIQLFEREATRRLKVGGAEKRASLTALSAAVALPADFGELRLATSGGVVLSYVTPMQLPDGGGPPAHYTIIGNEMRLGPSPSGGCTVEIVYQSGVPPLSDTNPSNWLLMQHPDCYLFGSLVEAESFIGSDDRIPLWAQRREAAFSSIESADRKARWGGAPLSIRAEGVSGGNGMAAGDWTSAPPVPIPIASIVAGEGLTGGGSEGIVTVALDTPVSVANGGTGNTFFEADRIVTGGGIGPMHSTSGRLDGLGDAYARSFATEGIGNEGGLWWGKYGGGFWKWALWSDTGDVAHFQRWEGDASIGDAFTVDHVTATLDVVGGINGAYVAAKSAGTDGGLWWQGAPSDRWSVWYGTAGTARLGLFETDTTTPAGDVLTVDLATRAASFAVSPQAPTPAPGDNDTSVATTAFVQAALAAGGSGINQLTGDVTAGPGSGSQAASLATVNANVGTFQGLTVNAKGLVTAAANQSYLTANQTITLSGDLTGSGTVAINAQIAANAVGTTEIAAANVTYAKIQNVTAARLLGNPTGSAAAPSEISLGTNLSFAGTVLNATGGGGLSGMTAGQIPIAATATTVTSSGNLSGAITTAGSLATTLANNAVATANITNANVTYAKIQNVAANRLLGNSTGSAAAPAEIALPLAVALGGTNATTAGAALTSLGAAPVATPTFTGAATADSFATTATASSGYTFYDRTVATTAWVGFATGGSFQLFNSVAAASIFTWSNTGTLTLGGTTAAIVVGAPTGGYKGNSTVNATAVYAAGTVLTSDASLKRDIGSLPQCLPLVTAIEPHSYRWREPEDIASVPPGWADRTRWGFIAQDVERVLADAGHGRDASGVVDVGEDGILGLSLGDMTAMLWRAVRELAAEVTELRGSTQGRRQ